MASFSCFGLKVVQFYISVKCSNILIDLSKKLSFSSFIYFYSLDGPNTRNLGETGQSLPYPSKGSNIMDDKKRLCYLTALDNILACNLKCLFIKVFICLLKCLLFIQVRKKRFCFLKNWSVFHSQVFLISVFLKYSISEISLIKTISVMQFGNLFLK